MKEIKIDLDTAQRIVELLAEFPYKHVADIIENIKEQAK